MTTHLKAFGYFALILDTVAAVSMQIAPTVKVLLLYLFSLHLTYRQSTTLYRKSSFLCHQLVSEAIMHECTPLS